MEKLRLVRPDLLSCTQMKALHILSRTLDKENYARIAKEVASVTEPERLIFFSLSRFLEKWFSHRRYKKNLRIARSLFESLPKLESNAGTTLKYSRVTPKLYDGGRSSLASKRSEVKFLNSYIEDANLERTLRCVGRFEELMFSSIK